MPKAIIQTNGTLAYLDQPDNAHKPVLILLHAFPQDHTMWGSQWEEISDTHRVIVPDFPGFGSTPLKLGWTIDSMADLLADLLDSLKITEPVTVGGLSMGGYTAMAFARRHPKRLKALILADTKAEADDETAKGVRDKTITLVRNHGVAALIDAMLPKLLGKSTHESHPEIAESVRQRSIRQSPEAVIEALKALRDRPDATPQLKEITVPTLVIVGFEDAVTPIEKSEQLANEIPNSKLVMIIGVGHLSNVEDENAFNNAVKEFLETVS